MKKIITQYAKIIAYLQLASALGIGACSIWYGAWYPDAQNYHLEKIKNSGKTDSKKPNFWDVSISEINWNTPPAYTILSLILGIIGGAGTIVSAFRLEELTKKEEDFKREEEEHTDTQKHYYHSLEHHLIELFCHKIDGFDDTCRASVYRYDNTAFRMVFRYSKITRYSANGRVTLPISEGFLGATYLNGDDLYINNLPTKDEKRGAYIREVKKQLQNHGVDMTELAIKRLKMPSRCYYGYSIRDQHSAQKIAILVLESTSPDKFNPGQVKSVLESNSNKITHYVRHIAQLDGKLNPYGRV